MTLLQHIVSLFAPHNPPAHVTVDAKLENAVFDLKMATEENKVTTQFLNAVLTAR